MSADSADATDSKLCLQERQRPLCGIAVPKGGCVNANHHEGSRPWARLGRLVSILRSRYSRFTALRLFHAPLNFVSAESEIGAVYEPSTSLAEELSDAAAGWIYHRTLSHCRRHRTIGSILREGIRRSHSERRRQQGRARVHPNREHVAHCQCRRRSDTRLSTVSTRGTN
jgi:hypothetical protein